MMGKWARLQRVSDLLFPMLLPLLLVFADALSLEPRLSGLGPLSPLTLRFE